MFERPDSIRAEWSRRTFDEALPMATKALEAMRRTLKQGRQA